MNYSEARLLWEPSEDPEHKSEKVLVVPHNLKQQAAIAEQIFFGHRRAFSGGAAYTAVRDATPEENKARVLIDFVTLVVRDNIDTQAAHAAFCEVQEYRDQLPPDAPMPDKWKDTFRREVNGEG